MAYRRDLNRHEAHTLQLLLNWDRKSRLGVRRYILQSLRARGYLSLCRWTLFPTLTPLAHEALKPWLNAERGLKTLNPNIRYTKYTASRRVYDRVNRCYVTLEDLRLVMIRGEAVYNAAEEDVSAVVMSRLIDRDARAGKVPHEALRQLLASYLTYDKERKKV